MADNPLHVDFFENQTGTGTIKSTPVKFFTQDIALFLSGNLGGSTVKIEVSPDDVDVNDPDAAGITWFSHPAGTYEPGDFDDPSNVNDWRNADLAEVWVRAVIEGATSTTDLTLKGRPRVEMIVNGY
jgi:hypothetical protein